MVSQDKRGGNEYMSTEQRGSTTLQDLVQRQKSDRERLTEAHEAAIHLAELLDNLPDRERQHIAPLLFLMAQRTSVPRKSVNQPDRKASIKSHALLTVVARNHSG